MKQSHILKILELMGVGSSEIVVSGDWVNCSCPLARATHKNGTDNNPSFGVQTSDDGLSFYKCYTCGSGTLSSLIHRFNFAIGYRPHLNAFYMDSQYDIDLEDTSIYKDKFTIEKEEIVHEVTNDHLYNYPLLQGAIGEAPLKVRDWLGDRGINLEVAYKYETRYDKYGNVIFPTIGTDGVIYNMQFRSTTAKAFWYLKDEENDVSFRKDQHWYGEQFVNLTSVIVVESQTDVLRLKSLGIQDPVIASCGNVTNAQLNRITAPIWFLAYDADMSGDKNAHKTYQVVQSSAVNVFKLDWGFVGIKDAGALSSIEDYMYVYKNKIAMKGGTHVTRTGVEKYKDKFVM